MATSVQRVLIIIILLNLLFGLANSFALGTNTNNIDTDVQTYYQKNLNWSENLREDMLLVNPDSQQYKLDKTFGNVELGQQSFGSLLLNGVVTTYSGCLFNEAGCSNEYEKQWIVGVTWLIWTINVLLGLEALYLWYSKKST